MSDYDALDGTIPDTEVCLNMIREHVEQARSMPMSASVMVNREELLILLEDAEASLPEEIRQSRWLLKERDEFLAKARKEAEEIIEAGRQQAERMVERTEVVRSARRTAEKTVEDAEDRARAMRLETEDYIDQKLAGFEVVLDRTMAAVQKGRERLQVVVEAGADPDIDVEDAASEFFNQDSN